MALKSIYSLSLIILLSACSSTSEQSRISCTKANNWQDVGYVYGSEGKPVRSHEAIIESCNLTFSDNDKESYLTGYEQGISEFCSFDSGRKLGVKGLEDPFTCPYEIRKEFVRGYKEGLLEFQERQKNLELAERMKEQRGLQSSANSSGASR